jgi:hypothetical protein
MWGREAKTDTRQQEKKKMVRVVYIINLAARNQANKNRCVSLFAKKRPRACFAIEEVERNRKRKRKKKSQTKLADDREINNYNKLSISNPTRLSEENIYLNYRYYGYQVKKGTWSSGMIFASHPQNAYTCERSPVQSRVYPLSFAPFLPRMFTF